MNFTTKIPISKSVHAIDYDSEVLSIGSCFAVNIAQKFDYFQFKHAVNPFGILFHPMAIEKFIRMSVEGKQITESDVFCHNEGWHSFDAHSDISNPDKETVIKNLNNAISSTSQKIQSATHVIITLGTAWVYRNIESGNLVANCHKVPQKSFSKELLSVESISESLTNIIAMLTAANPEVKIIFTVSPVRHIKDGFVENQRSKANLISALHNVLDMQPANYFPSYEIMMDELRDYRFYGEDLLHPSQMAVDYIWQRFADSWIAESAVKVMDEVEAVRKNRAHRPFNPQSESHRAFLAATDAKAKALTERFPHMNFK
ncbi:MAG: GSCFA domain-containing protein [Flavobacterium sp.]|nr:MAG: GSCFA domain-containing protein [Flavobacterium sp.]